MENNIVSFSKFYKEIFKELIPGFKELNNQNQIADFLQLVGDGIVKNAYIPAHSRSGKTSLISVAFAVWSLGKTEKYSVLTIIDEFENSKSNLLAKYIIAVRSETFKRYFPNHYLNFDDVKIFGNRLCFKNRNVLIAGCIDDSFTGAGFHTIIIDSLTDKPHPKKNYVIDWLNDYVFCRTTSDTKIVLTAGTNEQRTFAESIINQNILGKFERIAELTKA